MHGGSIAMVGRSIAAYRARKWRHAKLRANQTDHQVQRRDDAKVHRIDTHLQSDLA